MIFWFCQEIPVHNPPENTQIYLIGRFDPERQPSIEIYLQIGKDEEDACYKEENRYVLFHQTPSGRIPSDLDPDDILAKYNHKIDKFKHRFSGEEYTEIIKLFSLVG